MQPKKTESKPTSFYQRWSGLIVACTLIALPFSFYGAGRAIQTNVNRVEDWLPKSYQETQNLAWFRKNFASDQFVIISWDGCKLGPEGDAAGDDPRIQKLADLLVPPIPIDSSDLEASGHLTSTLATADEAKSPQEPIADHAMPPVNGPTPLFPAANAAPNGSTSPAVPRELDLARRRYFKAVVTGRSVLNQLTNPPLSVAVQEAITRLQGTMIGPDGQQTCVVVTLYPQALSELKQVLGSGQRRIFRPNVPPGALRELVALAGIEADALHLGGPPVDNSAIDEEGERTLVRLAGLSGLLGLGLAWWALRSTLLTALVFFCGVMSAAISLAIVWLSGQNVDAILMSMPSLVYVLAISGAVHLLNYYREAIHTIGFHGAAERAVKYAWKPAVLCSTTTAFGLLSLAASELVPIRKFGIFSAAGVIALVVVVYFFLPAALQWTGVGKRWLTDKEADKAPEQSHWLWERIATFIVHHYKLVGTGCIVATILVGLGLRYTSSSIDLLKLFDHRARILQDYRWLEANLGKLVPLEIVVRFPPESQRESQSAGSSEVVPLSFLQRLESVARMQQLIEKKFGPLGEDLISRSLSAVSFAPGIPSPNAGNYGYIQRKVFDARMRSNKVELSKAGFLRTDADGSELWRISLRVAAFRDVDYGAFVRELEQITQPLLGAYNARAQILTALAQSDDRSHEDKSNGSSRILLLGDSTGRKPANGEEQETFKTLLNQLLSEYKLETEVRPAPASGSGGHGMDNVAQADAAVVYGDMSDNDLRMVSTRIPNVIDARPSAKKSAPQLATITEDDHQLSAVYTGVVPIVYQAQRALLDSLVSSTWWSFLMITPIMMLVSRGLFAGFIAMVPNLVPILLIFGGMGWLGISIDVGSMMTASIALGVAVDDTIHFLARYRQELDEGVDKRKAIISTYGHCAVPTLQAALISGFGLSIFAFSTFTPTQRFGWLMLSILIAGVISELVLLPTLLASPLGRVFGVGTRRYALPKS